jgi:predicted O-methyltransferase YrrM
MNIQTFNYSEARFIAKNLILNRIGLEPLANGKLQHTRQFRQTVEDITLLEDAWEYIPEDNGRMYGRKNSNEPIRLWSVPSMTAKVLECLVIYTGAKNILEIGTSAGYSTLHLANAAKYNKGKVHTVEILEEKVKLARKHFKQANLERNINLLHADAKIVLEDWDCGMIDMVFLDADKENYGNYFGQIMPLLSRNSIIIADNINDYGHMMQDYLQKVTGTHLPESRCDPRVISTYLAQLDNGIMITKKL